MASESQPQPQPQPAEDAPNPETNGTVNESGSAAAAAEAEASQSPAEKPALPPLSASEFREWNRLATSMEYFHDHFRHSWKTLYDACLSGRRPQGMTLRQFIDEGLSLARYLDTHHNIEERYIFPILARKMPEFRSASGKGKDGKGGAGAGELLRQHRLIHDGMDGFEAYLRACRNRERELELPVLKDKMDTWGDVLLTHLNQEVETLGADNMRRAGWTLAEMRNIPM